MKSTFNDRQLAVSQCLGVFCILRLELLVGGDTP